MELYERFSTVLSHISKLGGSLNSAVGNYNSVLGSLEGRVMPTARKMAELGARTDKELPSLEAVEHLPREVSQGRLTGEI